MKKIKKKDKVKTKKSLLDSKDIKNKDKTNDKRSKKKKVKEVPTDQISLFDVAGGTDKEVKDE